MTENQLSKIVFDLGMKVHKSLGPGLLESSYEECLYYELCKTDLKVERQKLLPIIYEGLRMETSYRIDLMIEDKLIVELKAVENLTDLHLAQLLTYLRLSNSKLGMIMNFNVPLFKNGVKRVINGQLDK
jgi:GxxExxY protein